MVQRMRATIIDADGRTTEVVVDGTPYSPDTLDDLVARVRALHAAPPETIVHVSPTPAAIKELVDTVETEQARRRRMNGS